MSSARAALVSGKFRHGRPAIWPAPPISRTLRHVTNRTTSLSAMIEASLQDLPCAMGHEVDDEEQEDAEHGAGEALGDALGDVRDEDDEGGADDRAGQPADAADDHA